MHPRSLFLIHFEIKMPFLWHNSHFLVACWCLNMLFYLQEENGDKNLAPNMYSAHRLGRWKYLDKNTSVFFLVGLQSLPWYQIITQKFPKRSWKSTPLYLFIKWSFMPDSFPFSWEVNPSLWNKIPLSETCLKLPLPVCISHHLQLPPQRVS